MLGSMTLTRSHKLARLPELPLANYTRLCSKTPRESKRALRAANTNRVPPGPALGPPNNLTTHRETRGRTPVLSLLTISMSLEQSALNTGFERLNNPPALEDLSLLNEKPTAFITPFPLEHMPRTELNLTSPPFRALSRKSVCNLTGKLRGTPGLLLRARTPPNLSSNPRKKPRVLISKDLPPRKNNPEHVSHRRPPNLETIPKLDRN